TSAITLGSIRSTGARLLVRAFVTAAAAAPARRSRPRLFTPSSSHPGSPFPCTQAPTLRRHAAQPWGPARGQQFGPRGRARQGEAQAPALLAFLLATHAFRMKHTPRSQRSI